MKKFFPAVPYILCLIYGLGANAIRDLTINMYADDCISYTSGN